MAKKPETDLGDVHAPVEDTEVPLALIVLVLLMLLAIVGLGISLALTSNILPTG